MTESHSHPGAKQPATSPSMSATEAVQGQDATLAHVASSKSTPVSDLSPGPLAAGHRFDTYELLEKLGEGGMGSVWKARHVKLDKLVALKVLPPHLTRDPEAVRRFEREMRAVGKLDHPHVVRAMDAREVGGMHFLVMEYVEGVDLSKHVQRRGPRSVEDACALVRQAALGLAAAHAQGLVHRDVKPSNLLLSGEEQVKVLDLGLARLLSEGPEARQLTQSGQVLGTPDFMAPEQWDDTHAVDHRADLYALGCTLCFLLTGRAPFGDNRHSTMGQKMKGHVLEAPPRLRDLRPEVPEDLDELYAQLLVKEPEQRLASAAEVASRLKEIAQRYADRVPPHTRSEASPPRERSSRVWTMAGGVAAVLVLLGVIVIKIVNKDGTTTEIRVPEGASVELHKDGKVVAKVDDAQPARGTPATSSSQAPPAGTAPPAGKAPPLAVTPFEAAKAREYQEAWARYLGVPVEFTNSIGMKFRLIPPGEFTMGMTVAEAEVAAAQNASSEFHREMALSSSPPHKVRLTQAYYLGTCEVTQEQYEQVVGVNPSHFSADGAGQELVQDQDPRSHPVDMISFLDAAEFCIKLSAREMLQPAYSQENNKITLQPGNGYRLPTEAEWEWACRAGSTTYWWNSGEKRALDTVGWHLGNAGGRSHAVGQLPANPFGLYDVYGNVWEWCQDWHDPQIYAERAAGVTADPLGPKSGSVRVLRGGGSNSSAATCCSAFRRAIGMSSRLSDYGLRVWAGLNVPRAGR